MNPTTTYDTPNCFIRYVDHVVVVPTKSSIITFSNQQPTGTHRAIGVGRVLRTCLERVFNAKFPPNTTRFLCNGATLSYERGSDLKILKPERLVCQAGETIYISENVTSSTDYSSELDYSTTYNSAASSLTAPDTSNTTIHNLVSLSHATVDNRRNPQALYNPTNCSSQSLMSTDSQQQQQQSTTSGHTIRSAGWLTLVLDRAHEYFSQQLVLYQGHNPSVFDGSSSERGRLQGKHDTTMHVLNASQQKQPAFRIQFSCEGERDIFYSSAFLLVGFVGGFVYWVNDLSQGLRPC